MNKTQEGCLESRLAHHYGYLGPVPLLCLVHVAGCHCLILHADVSQGCCEVWLGHIQLHVDLLPGQLLLELPHLLARVEQGYDGSEPRTQDTQKLEFPHNLMLLSLQPAMGHRCQ